MATKRDYYEVLGISRDADGKTIKTAYRRLAVQYHPDKNPGDTEAEERFKEAAEAYAVLSETEKRARYDRFGHQGVGDIGGGAGFDPDVFGDFADILGDLFGFGGGRRRGRRPTRGSDLRYDLELTFEEAAFGIETTLKIPRLEGCETCSGSGAAKGSEPTTCAACGGRGQVRVAQGFFAVARPCPQCRGEGTLISDPCTDCRGEGRRERQRVLDVKIPPGVDTSARLRLVGEGEHGRFGGPPGDLYVVIRVAGHERFERSGADVLDTFEISYAQAVLGSEVEIETLHGSVELDIPRGTRHGKEFRLRGKGIDHLQGSGRGDHVVRVTIGVPHPRDLDEDRLDLLRKLAEIEGSEVKGDRVMDKVKKIFT